MAKQYEKESALKMRQAGCSIGEIARQLSVSKSTVSLWCRDLPLSAEASAKIARKGKRKSTLALLKYSEFVRERRKQETVKSMEIGAKRLGSLSPRDIYCVGLGLYWGEGYKKGSQEFGFTNSDPRMITFYIKWLRLVFKVKKSDLILRVSINEAHKHRIRDVEFFWSKHIGVPQNQFTKSSIVYAKSKKVYSEERNHMGTLRVKVRKGTSQRREVLGAINSIEV